jgi:hypothetical protein
MNNTGCLMLSFDKFYSDEITNLMSFDDTHLTGDGIETYPHITVIYGINIDKYSIDELIKSLRNKINHYNLLNRYLSAHEVGMFESKEYDIVKLEFLESSLLRDIRSLNSEITKEYEVVSEFDEYKPHSTLAYLVKGLGKGYVGDLPRVYPLKIVGARFNYKLDPESDYINEELF